jgi:hypothetical protein
MLPTFIIAGAPKSGTTALWAYLGEHPDVCMASVKEPRYFTRIVGRDWGGDPTAPWRSGEFDRGLTWYESLYRHCSGESQRGEATPTYLFAPDAPFLLKQTLPDIRILFILREPVSRLYSHYWEARAAGTRVADFATLVRSSDPRFQRYAEISAYGKHLARYYQVFPRERVLLLIQEEFSAAPLSGVQDAYRFIGVRPDYVPAGLGSRHNVATAPRSSLLQRILDFHVGPWVARHAPAPLYHPLRRLRERVASLNVRAQPYPPLDPDIRRELRARFASDITYVEDCLGRMIPAWRAEP